ncbi:MAG TPA: hypothetical protein VIK83_04465 [Coriobacteriia bacterium]
MNLRSNLMKGAATVAVLALAIAPMSAWAVPGMGGGKPPKANVSQSATATANKAAKTAARDARMALLKQRIAMVLARRANGFDSAATRIGARIDKVAATAGTVAAAGGDVTGVLSQLDAARTALVAAKTAEATAVDMFNAVPAATDKKAAFNAAKAQAHTARLALMDARSKLRNAILALEVVVNGLQAVTP